MIIFYLIWHARQDDLSQQFGLQISRRFQAWIHSQIQVGHHLVCRTKS